MQGWIDNYLNPVKEYLGKCQPDKSLQSRPGDFSQRGKEEMKDGASHQL
jgi:hypothetical protein